MKSGLHILERLAAPVSEQDIRDLAGLLVDAVESGAAVSFLAPLAVERAADWWRHLFAAADPRAIFLIARDAEGIAGSVQLHPAWAPNQPHRAEVVKLLVHRRARRRGLGTELMHAIEDAARSVGFTLLTLDAKRGEAAERLYRRLGWSHAGTIPAYAVDPDGTTPHDAVIFYKHLMQDHRAQPNRRRLISSGSSFERDIGYSRAVVQGGWIFVSGTTGFDYSSMTIADSLVEQTEQCLRNIQRALEEAGASFDDVVKVTYVLPNGEAFPQCWPVLRKYFGDVRPAAMMISAGLADPRMQIEIEVTACRPAGAAGDARSDLTENRKTGDRR